MFHEFRRGATRHLVASDLFTRGIDISTVRRQSTIGQPDGQTDKRAYAASDGRIVTNTNSRQQLSVSATISTDMRW